MSLGGTVYGTVTMNADVYTYYFIWSAKQSIEGNYSDVTVSTYWGRKKSWTFDTEGARRASITINGDTTEISQRFNYNPWVATPIQTKTTRVYHNTDGTKTIKISTSANGRAASWGPSSTTNASGDCIASSDEIVLNPIPRAATLLTVPDFNDEENPTITYTNPAGDSVTSLRACITLDGSTDDIAYRDVPKTGSSYTFELTEAERNVLRLATLNGKTSRTVKFYLVTEIGEYSETSRSAEKTFTVVNCTPKLSPTVQDVGDRSTILTGNSDTIIKGYNKIKVTFGASALKGATIVSKRVTCGSMLIDSEEDYLENVESNLFIFSVTDSRGVTFDMEVEKNLINYSKLTCGMDIGSPDANGDFDFYIEGSFFDGTFGAINNTLSVEYRYKVKDGKYPTNDNGEDIWYVANATVTDGRYQAKVDLSKLNYQLAYTFQARASDSIYYDYITTIERVVKTDPIFDWGENDFKFNVPVYLDKLTISDSLDTDKANINDLNVTKLSVSGQEIAIFPVEEGTSGIWKYRIWNTGKVELWGKYTFPENMACANTLGSMFRTAVQSLASVPFPFEISDPIMTEKFECRGQLGQPCATTEVSSSAPPNYYIIRPVSGTFSNPAYLHMYVVGTVL